MKEELKTVRASGSRLELVGPDAASVAAFGVNLMDYTRRPAAAKAGYEQGKAAAPNLQLLRRAA